jgi:tetratricopeptide (TPR) repeat protein
MAANHAISLGGAPERAYEQARTSLELAHELGVEPDYLQWVSVGATFMRSGHLDAARSAARRAIELAGDVAALRARAAVLLTAVERWSGDLDAAVEAASMAEAAARAAEQPLDLGQALMIRGYVELVDDAAAALPILEQAATISLEHLPAARTTAGFSLGLLGRARARLGDRAGTASALQQAVALTADDGSREEYGTVLGSVGAALLLLEEPDGAATMLTAAERVLDAPFLYLGLGVEKHTIDDRLIHRLGRAGFDDARARGETMSEAAARAFAEAALAGLQDSDAVIF